MDAPADGRRWSGRLGDAVLVSIADLDFETYSEAGYVWDELSQKWQSVVKSPPHGLGAVGAAAYAEHPSTEVLCMAYDLKDNRGPRLWVPGLPDPVDLFDHIARGGALEAHNSAFECLIWRHVCEARMGWPPLPLAQLRDSAAKCRAWSLPGALGMAAAALKVDAQKDKDGTRLIAKFGKPRNPTRRDPRRRITPAEDPADGGRLYSYCVGDIRAEAAVSDVCHDLSPYELRLWMLDQRANAAGMSVDTVAVDNLQAIVDQALARYNAELSFITGGAVTEGTKLQALKAWLGARGITVGSLDKDHADGVLASAEVQADPVAKRALEIRALVGSASVKKLGAIARRVSGDGTLKGLLVYCGADRTGRWAGRGPQPQNLPNSGPSVSRCACGAFHAVDVCPRCSAPAGEREEWGIDAVESVYTLAAGHDLAEFERHYPDPLAAVAGSLRGLFRAAPGHDLICSDFSAIEAVVLAELAGERWRQDVFRTHGKIYETSAAKITGIPFEEFERHKAETGNHHPMRKKIGKVAELASGYGGWIGAWKAFGADDHFGSDDEIKQAVLKWRDESPAIVEFWGGQVRKHPHRWEFRREYFGLEGAAVQAVLRPGSAHRVGAVSYAVEPDGVLYCTLPSGRRLSYHSPELRSVKDRYSGETIYQLSYKGYNTDYTKGRIGWVRLETHGGKLCENLVQAVSRDILAESLLNLDAAGYTPVLHVHDEIIAQVPEGTGTVGEFEEIMGRMPLWASDWPVRAAGGWRGKRYRKD